MTAAPSATSVRAVAAPMPPAAPVMRTTRSPSVVMRSPSVELEVLAHLPVAPTGAVLARRLVVAVELEALHHHEVVDERVPERLPVKRALLELVDGLGERLRQERRIGGVGVA